MHAKQNDPIEKEKKVNTAPIDYDALNKLSEHFVSHFVPQKQLSVENLSWLPMSKRVSKKPPFQPELVLKEIPHELPLISLVKDSFSKMRSHVNQFDEVITVRAKVTGQNEGDCLEYDNLETELLKKENDRLLKENDRLLELIISQDLVHTSMNNLIAIANYKSMEKSYSNEYNENLDLLAELSNRNDTVEKAIYNELS
nr:hypothetical protein [Tanacetum cinerariifolium]